MGADESTLKGSFCDCSGDDRNSDKENRPKVKPTDKPNAVANKLRHSVSKKKNRLIREIDDGKHKTQIDLDMSYIPDDVTGRIIAMGMPCEGGISEVYRNPLRQVQALFNHVHKDKGGPRVKVYNLVSEEYGEYDGAKAFGGAQYYSRDFTGPDHNPPAFKKMVGFAADAKQWLAAHPKNVVAVHCKAGKGRTGCQIASYLVSSGAGLVTASDALNTFGQARTRNNKGVTIPSQQRYVRYMEQFTTNSRFQSPRKLPDVSPEVVLTSFVLHKCPDGDFIGGCDPYIEIEWSDGKDGGKYCSHADPSSAESFRESNDTDCKFEIKMPADVKVRGDVLIRLMDYDSWPASPQRLCQMWLNTNFIYKSQYVFGKYALDGAHKDKKIFHEDFKLEMNVGEVQVVSGDDAKDVNEAVFVPEGATKETAHEDGDDDEAPVKKTKKEKKGETETETKGETKTEGKTEEKTEEGDGEENTNEGEEKTNEGENGEEENGEEDARGEEAGGEDAGKEEAGGEDAGGEEAGGEEAGGEEAGGD